MIKVKGWFVNSTLDQTGGQIISIEINDAVWDWIWHHGKKRDQGKKQDYIATIYFDKATNLPPCFYIIEFNPKEQKNTNQQPKPKLVAAKKTENFKTKKTKPPLRVIN